MKQKKETDGIIFEDWKELDSKVKKCMNYAYKLGYDRCKNQFQKKIDFISKMIPEIDIEFWSKFDSLYRFYVKNKSIKMAKDALELRKELIEFNKMLKGEKR